MTAINKKYTLHVDSLDKNMWNIRAHAPRDTREYTIHAIHSCTRTVSPTRTISLPLGTPLHPKHALFMLPASTPVRIFIMILYGTAASRTPVFTSTFGSYRFGPRNYGEIVECRQPCEYVPNIACISIRGKWMSGPSSVCFRWLSSSKHLQRKGFLHL